MCIKLLTHIVVITVVLGSIVLIVCSEKIKLQRLGACVRLSIHWRQVLEREELSQATPGTHNREQHRETNSELGVNMVDQIITLSSVKTKTRFKY